MCNRDLRERQKAQKHLETQEQYEVQKEHFLSKNKKSTEVVCRANNDSHKVGHVREGRSAGQAHIPPC